MINKLSYAGRIPQELSEFSLKLPYHFEVSKAASPILNYCLSWSSPVDKDSWINDPDVNRVHEVIYGNRPIVVSILSKIKGHSISFKELFHRIIYVLIGQSLEADRINSRPTVTTKIEVDEVDAPTDTQKDNHKFIFKRIVETIVTTVWRTTKQIKGLPNGSNGKKHAINFKRSFFMANKQHSKFASSWKARGTYSVILTSFTKRVYEGTPQIMIGMKVTDGKGFESGDGLNYFLNLTSDNECYRQLVIDPQHIENELDHEATVEFFIEHFKKQKGIVQAKYDDLTGFNRVFSIASFKAKDSLERWIKEYRGLTGTTDTLN